MAPEEIDGIGLAASGDTPPIPTFAVILTTYAWDDFVKRQYARMRTRVGSGTLFVLADETHGALGPIEAEHVLRVTEADVLELGYANVHNRSLFWHNLDYLTYFFQTKYPDFDYYITMDYDALINTDIDRLLATLSANGIDFAARPVADPLDRWVYTKPHQQLYPREDILGYLLCITILSNRAVRHLAARRLELSAHYAAGGIRFWPFCEAFVPTEVSRAGFAIADLADYGNTAFYKWWPPVSESAIEAVLPEADFVHPVLDQRRYIQSLLRHEPRLLSIFRAGSVLRRKLAEFPSSTWTTPARREFGRRLHAAAERRLPWLFRREPHMVKW